MGPSALLCLAVFRPFLVFNRKTKLSLWGILAVLACQISPAARAQSAHFSGVQTIVPTSSMNHPTYIASDANGNLYISDSNNHRILKETLSGGTYTESIVANSTGATAGVAVDTNGNVYYADTATNTIYKETPSGSTYAQSVVPTSALSSALSYAVALAADSNGNVYISDTGNNRVLKETLSGGAYTESTIGSGLSVPEGLAVDPAGNVYISDLSNSRLLKETLSGGTYTQSSIIPGGLAASAIAVDATGNVFIADFANNRALKETLSGSSYTQSIIPTNSLNNPFGIAVDGSGNVYIAQAANPISGILKEWAPTASANFGTVNVGSPSSILTLFFTFDSPGTISAPAALTQGNPNLDFTDAGTGTCTTNGTSHTYSTDEICGVDTIFTPKAPGSRSGAGVLQNSAGYAVATAYIQGTGAGPQVNFPPGVQSTLSFNTTPNNPYAVAVDAAGNLYLALAVSANSPQNAVVKETWTGSGYTQSTVKSGLAYPVGVAVDGAGNVYIADQNATAVYKMAPYGTGYVLSTSMSGLGNVEAIATDGGGNVYIGTLGASELLVNTLTTHGYVLTTFAVGVHPFGIAVDRQNNIYLADNVNNQIVKLTPGSPLPSTIITGLSGPHGIAVDGSGNLYIADTFNNRVVKETLSGGTYTQSTLLSGVNDPLGVVLDAVGNVFVTSDAANTVLKIDLADPPSLTFPATAVGLTSSSQTVTVQNVGNTSLTFPVPATGNNPSIATNFSLNSGGASACPLLTSNSSAAATIAAGSSCQLPISFAPIASGSITGSLVLTDDLNASAPAYTTQTITLSGTGSGPDLTSIAITASDIVFGQTTTLHATVSDTGNTGITPAGSVTFGDTVGGTSATLLGTVNLSGGTGAYTYTPTSAGAHTIIVSYTPSNPATFQSSSNSLGITVSPATPVITWANPSAITYGTALSATQLNATANVPGTFVYTPAAGAVPSAGTTMLRATFNPTDTTNYSTATKSVSLQVNQQATATTLTLSATSITPGQSLTLTAKVTAASSGTPTGTTTFLDGTTVLGTATLTNGSATYSTTALLSGSHTLTATYSGDTNYSASTSASSSSLTVAPLDFTVAVSGAASQTMARGSSASFFLAVAPTYGAYPAALTFTASGLPSGASATFTPSTLTTTAGPQTVGLTIQTSSVAANDNHLLRPGSTPLILAILVLPIAGAGRWRRAGQKLLPRVMLIFLLIAAAAATAGLSGCSTGSGSQTPNSQNYTVTVTATAGSVQHTATVSLTVQ